MKANNENAFPYKFLEIFKEPSFHCQKFVDLKSLWESSDLYEILISIIKVGGLFIRFFAKAVATTSKSKNEKYTSSVFGGRSNLYGKFIYKLTTTILSRLCISVKTLLWYSTNLPKTANKMSFPFNFAKISKGRHFKVRKFKNLKLSLDTAIDSAFQEKLLESLLLSSFVCY